MEQTTQKNNRKIAYWQCSQNRLSFSLPILMQNDTCSFLTLLFHVLVAGHPNMMPTKESQSPSKPIIPLPKGPANEWTIKEVIQYITATDPALGVHASLFRKHVSNLS